MNGSIPSTSGMVKPAIAVGGATGSRTDGRKNAC